MEESCSTKEDGSFFNALDDFPFYDCLDCSAESEPQSPLRSSSSDSKLVEFTPNSPSMSSSSGLRRRRSFAKHTRRGTSSENLSFGASAVSEVSGGGDVNYKKTDSDGTESGLSGVVDSVDEERFGDFVVTSSNNENEEDRPPGFVFLLAEMVIKAIGFQLRFIIGFVSFPFWVFYTSYMFLVSPCESIRSGRDYVIGKLVKVWNLVMEPYVSEWFRGNHSSVNVLAVRCAWGLFWSAYVCSLLVGLLVTSFVGSGLIMRCLVEEPFHQKHPLNLDFTQNKPVAVVPIAAAWSGKSSVDFGESILIDIPRPIFPNRKLQATVRLTLPDSDYNRHLGMFQVRIEFMSANGKTLGSLRQPSMLHFRSDPIRLLQVFLKIVPLVVGYSSESQTLNLKFEGFTEGDVPSAYMKVIIEQRAEFRPAGGIPEVYDAALLLESELPLLKSLVWCWRKTLFVWVSMVLFMIQLLFALLCCRTVVMPPTFRPHNNIINNNNNNAAGNTATPTNQQNAT